MRPKPLREDSRARTDVSGSGRIDLIMPGDGPVPRIWQALWFFPAFAFAGVYAYARALASDAYPAAVFGALMLCITAVLYWDQLKRLPVLAVTAATLCVAPVAAHDGPLTWLVVGTFLAIACCAELAFAHRLRVPLANPALRNVAAMACIVAVVTIIGSMTVAGLIAAGILAPFITRVRPRLSRNPS